MTVRRWYAQDEVNQEDSEHNEVDGMKKGADSDNYIVSNHVSDETNVSLGQNIEHYWFTLLDNVLYKV